MVQLPWNEKQIFQLNSWPQMWPSGLTLAMTLTLNFQGQIWNLLYHDLDLWILKVKCDLDLWPHTWPWPWIFMVKFWNSCISEWEGWLTLHKGGGSRSVMTMTMTIWWARSGVWIYQIVTGVTSVVGVPSTHLVSSHTLPSLWFLMYAVIKVKPTRGPLVDASILLRCFFCFFISVAPPILTLFSPQWGHCTVANGKILWSK